LKVGDPSNLFAFGILNYRRSIWHGRVSEYFQLVGGDRLAAYRVTNRTWFFI
jgi:hypothetical protein